MSEQDIILLYSKEARAWLDSLAPFFTAIIMWLLPSPLPKRLRLKKPNEPTP